MDESKKKTDELATQVALSRREWLLSLGSAIVLAGSSGAPGEAARGAEPAVPAAQTTAGGVASLPPGLYMPSYDHLTHVLTRDEPFVVIPPGAETDYVRPRSKPFSPAFFSQHEFQTVRRIVEILLGEDLKDPGQEPAAGGPANIYDEVAEWIDLVAASSPAIRALALGLSADQRALAVAYFGDEEPVRRLETFEPERVCREGLAWLGEESRRRFGKDFLGARPAGQFDLVRAMSGSHADQSAANAGTRMFEFLKAQSIRGFYTSRIGLKELGYTGNSFHAESPGCALTPQPPGDAGEPE